MRVILYTFVALSVASVKAGHYYPERGTLRPIADRNPEESNEAYWRDEARAGIEKRLSQVLNTNKARNVIMFLGDGMSMPTLAAARTLLGQRQGHTGEEAQLYFESFPTVGLAKTYCLDHQVADSACTATACLTGVKTNFGVLGISGHVSLRECAKSTNTSIHLDTIAAWALADGRDAGIVTNTRISHATPAGAYARTSCRYWENDAQVRADGFDPTDCPDIAYQLVRSSPANQFKVILGGGRRELLPNTEFDEENTRGTRSDGRNLIQEWQEDKASRALDYKYVWNRTDLLSLMENPPDYLLGLFDGSHMPYHLLSNDEDPSLTEMTEIAIRSLNRNEKGFFLFIESGRIDQAHHENLVKLSLDETIEMDLAIKKAIELLGVEETLVVVTSDHSHVLAFNGYTERGSDILGPSNYYTTDDIPYMTLSYTNGPGARTHVDNRRVDVTQDQNFFDPYWRTHADVPMIEETHGGDDVAVFAIGPYHHMFSGLYEQTQLPHLMGYAACIGPGLHSCNLGVSDHPVTSALYLLIPMILSAIQ